MKSNKKINHINLLLSSLKKGRNFSVVLFSILALLSTGCSKEPEPVENPTEKTAEVVPAAPTAPTMSYEQLIVSDNAVGDIFYVQGTDYGNALNYLSRAGVINLLDYVVEYPDGTGYVVIEKAYGFGNSYILIVSTGEHGASCPASTYAIAFDTKAEMVTGQEAIDGCSENLESLSDGNKLIVKKDGEASVFYNGEIKQAPRSLDRDNDYEEELVSQDTASINKAVEQVEYKELMPFIRHFSSLTELNQDSWNEANEWKHYVKGTCTVSEVAKVTFLSEIDNAAYEVDCEMASDDRAVLFFDEKYQQQVSNLTVGQVISFEGRLKNIQTPMWTSAYIKVD